MANDTEKLASRIRRGEDSALELKNVVLDGDRVDGPGKRDLADELAAFANTRGGTVVLGADDKTREIKGIPLESLDTVEGWVREICDDSVTPALDADIFKLELDSACGAPCSRRANRDSPQPLRAPKLREILPPTWPLEAGDGSGCSRAAVPGTQPEPG